MPRKYELKQRAEQVEETQRRIVEAAVELHGTIGPARTTVSAIADRAGVQRQTYYRHFPHERDLLLACSGLDQERNPPPDPEAWAGVADAGERLRRGLSDLYAYYAANEPMLANVVRDAAVHPLTREIAELRTEWMRGARDVLARGLPRSARSRAALDLAFDFTTWQGLVRRSGLDRAAAVDLMARLVLGR
jgi:AcrR family transcriptional regulator